MSEIIPKFGDIYFAKLIPNGAVQGGSRPVLISQNDIGNKHSPSVEIIPLTSKIKASHMPTHTLIKASDLNGLNTDSVVLSEQTQTINKTQLWKRLGRLTLQELAEVGRARRIQSPFPVI